VVGSSLDAVVLPHAVSDAAAKANAIIKITLFFFMLYLPYACIFL
jgi:hypothetical protein